MTPSNDNTPPSRWTAWALLLAACAGVGLTVFTLILAVMEVV